MDEEDKVMKMFTDVHGEVGGNSTVEVIVNAIDHSITGVKVIGLKDGRITNLWSVTKSELVFDWITRNW